MKSFLICAGFLLFSVLLTAQKDFEKEKIIILPESELIIAGSTNVNKFDCSFNIELISKPLSLKFTEVNQYHIFKNLELKLLTEGFDCGHKRMNADFQDLLMSEKFPEIVISVNKAELFSAEYQKVFITVKIAGEENSYQLPVHIENNRFKGKFKMNIRDFGLEPPKKALGLIEVYEMIEVQFNLLIKRV